MFGTLNPKLKSLKATDNTILLTKGKTSIAVNPAAVVTSVDSGDGYVYFSPSVGSAIAYVNMGSLASGLNSYFVPYTGATQDINLGAYNYISELVGFSNYYSDYPSSTSFNTSYTPIDPYTITAIANAYMDYLYDYYADGFLYDGSYAQQATINHATGYIDTTPFNSWNIDQVDYYVASPTRTTTISYNGSTFANGLTSNKNSASQAGYFSDAISGRNVYLCDGSYAVNAYGTSYFTEGTNSVSLCNGSYALDVGGSVVISSQLTVSGQVSSGNIYSASGADVVSLCDGSYAINATGTMTITGQVTSSGFIATSDSALPNVYGSTGAGSSLGLYNASPPDTSVVLGTSLIDVTGAVKMNTLDQGAGAPATILTSFRLYVDTATGIVYCQ